jgi:hypothetical protein
MDTIMELLRDILARLTDTQSRAARIETRLMKLADAMNINVKGTHHE